MARSTIVFLDRATIGPGVTIRRPQFDHAWIDHPQTAPDRIVERLADAEIAITNKVPLRAETIAALPRLRMIAVAATGTDVIDVPECRRRGITVSNIRGYATTTVPEHTFALILALRRNLVEYRDQVLSGRWQDAGQFCFFNRPIRDLAGATLGVVGSGALGRAVAALGHAFGMKIMFCNPHVTVPPPGERFVSLDELLHLSDVVTLHLPLTAETRGMIGREELRRMRPDAILVNTARGGIVDEDALLHALQEGWIAGAALDVVSREPPAADSAAMQIARLPNAIVTPHVAWASIGAMQRLCDQLIDNIEAYERGAPVNVVG
ncbi:MAG: D-2-hydroxyacid dehydrogenase [Gemmatimonas sp.]